MSVHHIKPPIRTWQEIAAEAAREMDAQKLLALTTELERALDERDKVLHKLANPSEHLPKNQRKYK